MSDIPNAAKASTREDILSSPVGILGAGMAGLISAYVLLQDGFKDITVITRDTSVGGTWSRTRVYPGLRINSIHDVYRFSALRMPPPEESDQSGGHITGQELCDYMEQFYSLFLMNKVKFKFEEEINRVRRDGEGVWEVSTSLVSSREERTRKFSRIILATGGCSTPSVPDNLSAEAAKKVNFKGMVLHSSEFRLRLDEIIKRFEVKKPESMSDKGTVLVIGGGRSGADICARLATKGRRVIHVFGNPEAFIASRFTLPDFITKSRVLSVLNPHILLNTKLEQFLHKTVVGGWITHRIFNALQEYSLESYSVPKNSPLRKNMHSVFWGIRTSDEGRVHEGSYYSQVNKGLIELLPSTRGVGYSEDGKTFLLSNGQQIIADVVILATGYKSSWEKLFDESTAKELGIHEHPPIIDIEKTKETWNDYISLSNPPPTLPQNDNKLGITSIYRGIVPARNIAKRDFAIIGALFAANASYTNEVASHWISSYFQGDSMVLPRSIEEAIKEAEIRSVWMRKRYPATWVNESYRGVLDLWTWPQIADELLQDMHLPAMRSGGNWLTWPFRVIKAEELATLSDERSARRNKDGNVQR